MGQDSKRLLIKIGIEQLRTSIQASEEVNKTAKRIVDKWITKTERRLLKDPLLTREVHLKY
jgi:hypothetical protein